MLSLQEYDYKVVYRLGKGNIADALSRLNQTTPCDVSGDKIDFVKMVAVECTPSAPCQTSRFGVGEGSRAHQREAVCDDRGLVKV